MGMMDSDGRSGLAWRNGHRGQDEAGKRADKTNCMDAMGGTWPTAGEMESGAARPDLGRRGSQPYRRMVLFVFLFLFAEGCKHPVNVAARNWRNSSWNESLR
jgi:hypothetical protein